ncbi:hypothetical protein [Paramicrobacterium agarici]|uniref:hypothetical protein n=1 Tax=Paramicrobacterium agarici TaxID=630514 RepID=UPI001153EADD|nr:hypothetical protein [Microbacterium agarici]TQO23706.1 hypothetical protein FB385_2564 [Microbacterium agarici]
MELFSRLENAAHKVSRVYAQAETSAVAGLAGSGGMRRRAAVGSVSELVQQMPDDAVNQLLWQAGQLRRAADAVIAIAAAETKGRSETAASALAGVARSDVEQLARVGAMIEESERVIDACGVVEAEALDIVIDVPWWHSISLAVIDGGLSPASAAAMRENLGEPGGVVTTQRLAQAAEELTEQLVTAAPDAVAEASRQKRAALEGATELVSSE